MSDRLLFDCVAESECEAEALRESVGAVLAVCVTVLLLVPAEREEVADAVSAGVTVDDSVAERDAPLGDPECVPSLLVALAVG